MSANLKVSKYPVDIHNFQILFPQYNSTVFKAVISLSDSEDYQNLVFICKGNVNLKCNKIVFSCASNFIKRIICDTGLDTVYVSVPDVKSCTLSKILKLIYKGFIEVNNQEHAEFLDTCLFLGIDLPDLPVIEVNRTMPPSISEVNIPAKKECVNFTETVWSFDSDRAGLKLYCQTSCNNGYGKRKTGQRKSVSVSASSVEENLLAVQSDNVSVTREPDEVIEIDGECLRTVIIPFFEDKIRSVSTPPTEVLVGQKNPSTERLNNVQNCSVPADSRTKNNTVSMQVDLPSVQASVESKSITIIPFSFDTDIVTDKMRQDCISPSFLKLLDNNCSTEKLHDIACSLTIRDTNAEVAVNDTATFNGNLETRPNSELNTVINMSSSSDTDLANRIQEYQNVSENDSSNEEDMGVEDSSEINDESCLVSDDLQENIEMGNSQAIDISELNRATSIGCTPFRPVEITRLLEKKVLIEDVCNENEKTANKTIENLENGKAHNENENLIEKCEEITDQNTENNIACEEQSVVEVDSVTTSNSSTVEDTSYRCTQSSPVVRITQLGTSFLEERKQVFLRDLPVGNENKERHDEIIEIPSDDDDEPTEKYSIKSEKAIQQNKDNGSIVSGERRDTKTDKVPVNKTSGDFLRRGVENGNSVNKYIEKEQSNCTSSLLFYKCDLCEKSFLSTISLKHHLTSHSGAKLNTGTNKPESEGNYQPTSSSESRKYTPELIKQEEVQSGINKHFCMVCKKEFIYKKSLLSHMYKHSKSFHNLVYVKKQVYIKKYECDYCKKLLIAKQNLIRHINIHTGMSKYTCNICRKSFTDKTNLQRHHNIHTGLKKYTCDVCQKSFLDRAYLTRHCNIHTGLKNYTCDVCQKSFLDKACLTRHCNIHTGIKKYKCTVCNKSFTDRSTLTRHRNIHIGVGKYKCYLCNKLFTDRTTFIRHRNIHSGIKKYKCDLCNKLFMDKSTFTRHRIKHMSVIKKYECDLCNKLFIYEAAYTQHLNTHN